MNIDTQAILRFTESMIKVIDKDKHYSEFEDGKRVGFQLVEQFIKTYENIEGKRIAQHLNKGV